jgi:hypothetical protein
MKNSSELQTVSPPAERSPDRLLSEDHHRLDRLFDALVTRAQGGDPIDLRAEWEVFERGLLRHLELEEHEILPGFARDDPAGAKAILDEHGAIRDALVEMGISLDLHLLRADAVQAFCDRLRAHAAREEAALYRWATRQIPRSRWAALGRRLAAAGGGRGD